jgi:transketolase
MKTLEKAKIPTRLAFGTRMQEYGAIDESFAVFEADIGSSTSSILFGKSFPERYFDMGIAELGMVSAAAGMAAGGRTAVASSYGIFLTTRALEAIRSFICYPNLNVKFMGSHGGLSAAIDGVTHQATEDIGNMVTLPNMHVAVPCDTQSARKIFDLAMATKGPFYVRLLRDAYYELYDENTEFVLGGSHIVREGESVTIGTYGDMVFQALEAAEELEKAGIHAEVIDFYSLKPLDYETLRKSIRKTGHLFVVENHMERNGMGYEIADYLMQNQLYIPYRHIGIHDTFAESGKYLDVIKKYHLDHTSIVDEVKCLVKGSKT